MLSIGVVAGAYAVAIAFCVAFYGKRNKRLVGLTDRSKVLRGGYLFLKNKYYLDALYEGVIVRAIAHPIAAATYWFNQHVIDGIVNGVGHNTKKTGEWVYNNVDQLIVDGVVNGSGHGRFRDRPRTATHPIRQGQPIRCAAVRRDRRRCHRPRHRQRELKVLLKIHANTH